MILLSALSFSKLKIPQKIYTTTLDISLTRLNSIPEKPIFSKKPLQGNNLEGFMVFLSGAHADLFINLNKII